MRPLAEGKLDFGSPRIPRIVTKSWAVGLASARSYLSPNLIVTFFLFSGFGCQFFLARCPGCSALLSSLGIAGELNIETGTELLRDTCSRYTIYLF